MKIFYSLFFLSLLFILTGCSTDEVRKQELMTDLVLDDEKAAKEAEIKAIAEKAEAEKKKAAPINSPKPEPMFKEAPAMEIDAEQKKYQAVLKTTKGDISVSLTAKETPITVNNFVFLARKNFYNNTPFHRTIKDFMIQGGDPTGTGTGGPGYKFNDEVFNGEYTKGTLAMANSGPNTNGSQFFIMHGDTALPKNYVIFGKVIEGMEVVDAIATAPTKTGMSGENSTPVELVYIESVTIEEEMITEEE